MIADMIFKDSDALSSTVESEVHLEENNLDIDNEQGQCTAWCRPLKVEQQS